MRWRRATRAAVTANAHGPHPGCPAARGSEPRLDLSVRAGLHQHGLVLPKDDLRPDRVAVILQESCQLFEFGPGLLADRRAFELEESVGLQREVGRLRCDESSQ